MWRRPRRHSSLCSDEPMWSPAGFQSFANWGDGWTILIVTDVLCLFHKFFFFLSLVSFADGQVKIKRMHLGKHCIAWQVTAIQVKLIGRVVVTCSLLAEILAATACLLLPPRPFFFKKQKNKKTKHCPLSLHDFWQATERLESDSPHFLPLILSSCSTFGSVSFWHKWASATVLQCWFHASNCSLPSKAILKSPPFFFGDVPRQTRGIRRKTTVGLPLAGMGNRAACSAAGQNQDPYEKRRRALTSSKSWEVLLVRRRPRIWVDGWKEEHFHDRMRSFLRHFALARFPHRCFSESFRFLPNCAVQVVGGPAAAPPQIQSGVRVVGECLKSASSAWFSAVKMMPPPQMAREKSVRALGKEASAVS